MEDRTMDRLPLISLSLFFSLAAAACSPNYAVDLDGQGDFVEIQSSVSLQPSSAITLEAWTLPSENASISLRQPILSKGRAPGSLSYALWFQNGEVAFELSGTGSFTKATSIVRADAPDRGSWHHIAGTWNRSNHLQRLFIDGILRAEGTTSFDAIAYNTSAQVFIGGQDSDGDNASDAEMNGQIDEVRVWSVARSPHEIQVSMNQKLRGNEEGLEAYWQFD
ncbi:MAG: LamG domain-containing protein, partial [Deltaproteobacteria bacterium]